MDTEKQTSPITYSPDYSCAQLWIGSHHELVTKTHRYMQQRWCPAGGCTRCITCSLIEQHQYHSALWVAPEGNYTREKLEIIFDTLRFALDDNREMIIVIQQADYLTAACYNSLLKSIEEPPQGYHFLLLAERLDAVAPTIRSRCTITHFNHSQTDIRQHPLAKFFLNNQYENPLAFAQALELADLDEHETAELVDALIQYWITEFKKATLTHTTKKSITQMTQTINILGSALEEPPMSGSSKIFWKNLFVQLKR